MHVIRALNVTSGLVQGLRYLAKEGVRSSSRAGDVIEAPGPVTTIFDCPIRRVITSPIRDANPFFHLIEALWMLGGRSDATFLDHYVSDFGERFAEDGIIHGSYGERWRWCFGFDQIEHIIEKLKKEPNTRQAVLQMWDAHDHASDDLRYDWKDRPCNTHIYFMIRNDELTMTVCCRSNDIVWGTYGANAVHFSVLMEYVATALNVSVGPYYQISNNYHIYLSELERLRNRAHHHFKRNGNIGVQLEDVAYAINPLSLNVESFRLFQTKAHSSLTSIQELLNVVKLINTLSDVQKYISPINALTFTNPSLLHTIEPLALAHRAYRLTDYDRAMKNVNRIFAPDWRLACKEWLARRIKDTK